MSKIARIAATTVTALGLLALAPVPAAYATEGTPEVTATGGKHGVKAATSDGTAVAVDADGGAVTASTGDTTLAVDADTEALGGGTTIGETDRVADVDVNDDGSVTASVGDTAVVQTPAIGGNAPTVRSAVVGYISIVSNGANPPTVVLYGHLATPDWSCTTPATFNPLLSYAVTCVPVTSAMTFTCDVLHADINTLTKASQARTTMDCNGDGVPEAQTQTVSGQGGYDFQWGVAATAVTQFVCRVDNGLGGGGIPEWRAGCGDPGLPSVE